MEVIALGDVVLEVSTAATTPASELVPLPAVHVYPVMVKQARPDEFLTLGARASIPGWYVASTLQGNGQSTMHVPTQHIPSTFRIFPANFPAISLVWGMSGTFTVSWIT